MARTINSEKTRREFSRRLQEELDRVGFPRKARGTSLARIFDVTHTTTNAWLRGAMPAVGALVDICNRLGLDFTYLCTGERAGRAPTTGIDPELFRKAVQQVNHHVEENGWFEDIGLERLGVLYMRAYIALVGGSGEDEILEDIRLAAGQ